MEVILSKIFKHLNTFCLIFSLGSAIRTHIWANNGAHEFKQIGN